MVSEKEKDNIIAFWTQENLKDERKKPPYGDFASRRMFLETFGKIKGKKILDIGCGSGRNMKWLESVGATVTGVDLSPELVKATRKLGLDVVEGDATKLPFKDNTFDVVYSLGVVEHFEETEKAVKEHVRVCKKGGTIAVVVPNKLSPFFFIEPLYHLLQGTNKYGMQANGKKFSKRKLMEMLENAGMKDVQIRPYYGSVFMLGTGKYNEGLAKAIEDSFIAKKLGFMLWGWGKKK